MTSGNGGNFSDMSMMDLFRQEAENQCATLSDDLLALEQTPRDAGLLESLMRASHSIKGAARIVDLDAAVTVAHAMEDVFVAAQKGKITLDREGIDLLFKTVDVLQKFGQLSGEELNSWLADNRETIERLTDGLKDLEKGTGGSPAEPEPAAGQPPPAPAPPAEENPPPQQPAGTADFSDMSMLDLFRQEAENQCATISDDLLALEQNPRDAGLLESLMRASHSIKGAARVVELDTAVRLAHAMEDVFVAAQKETISLAQDDIDILFRGVDLLNRFARTGDAGTEDKPAEDREAIDSLVETLAERARGKPLPDEKPAAGPEAPPPAAGEEKAPEQPRPETPPKPQQPPQKPARRAEDKEGVRTVRISADSMNRLMGLAGEVLIESRWLPSFTKEVLRLKQRQDELLRVIDNIREEMGYGSQEDMQGTLFADLMSKVEQLRDLTVEDMGVLDDHARHATEISHRLYHEVIASRMQPFNDGIRGFPRMVRDLSRELEKKVKLEIVGADTLVDRDILEKIESPLNHMLRNAIDHGIETPAERREAGKPEEAVLRLEARHSSGMLNIIVSDDGRGVDLEKLRKTVVDRKMVTVDIAAELSNSELMEFLFLPNFSTRGEVSKVSGRGVGMDVVHNVINEVRGRIRSSTRMGAGTTFELQLPLTLSVLRALLTEISGEPYAFPLVAIDHVLRLPQKEIKEVEGRQYFTLNDRRIGLVSAHQIFDTQPESGGEDEDLLVIVFSDRLNQYGLIIDRFWGVRDLVVQTLDPRLGKIKDINSAAILEDGTPVLIIDVDDMVRSMDQLISGNRLLRIGQTELEPVGRKVKRILVADDSITVREVERKMLSARGYEVEVAIDGMDAWNSVRNNDYNLVVTDVDMPRMDGIELVSMIKNDARFRHLPVIIVSYKDRPEDRNRGLEAGADYYLTKGSFQDETLVNAVRDLIGGP